MFDRSRSLRAAAFLLSLASCTHGLRGASPTERAASQWDALVTPSTTLASVPGVPSAPRIDLDASSVEVSSDIPAPVGSHLSTRQFDRAEMLQALQGAWRSSKAGASTPAREPVRVVVSAAVYHRGSEVAGLVLHGLSGYVTALFGAPLECARAEVVLVVGTQDGRHFAGRGSGSGCLGLYSSSLDTVSATGDALSAALGSLRPISAEELAELVPSLGLASARARSAGLADRVIWPALPTQAFPVEWVASAQPVEGTAVATQAGDFR